VDAFIDHLDRNGTTLKSYTFRGLFPTGLPGFTLGSGPTVTVADFEVTWQYQYFETDTTT